MLFLFSRTSSRPDSVKVIPIIENDCSTKAVVTSAGSFSHKTTGIVLAQDQSTAYFTEPHHPIITFFIIVFLSLPDTGELFRCDVIVNHIYKIQIAMKTRELFIEDAPEEFYARALDDQGKIEFLCVLPCLFSLLGVI